MNLLLRATRALLLAVVLLGSAIATSSALAAAGVRANVTYQARLMDASGYPVADGVYQVRFSLYDAAIAGTRLWTAAGTTAAPTPVNVSVQDGLFTVLLGDGVTQLPFGDLDWNSDSLYLGVTIGADAEMSPRRPITAVPQAINSAQLGGMSPSSTGTFGGQSQFTINQASTTAATSTRSALDVISNGTSLTNDFILRAITNAGSPAFTITSQGVVSTTNLLVTGQNVCLANGTNCLPASEFDTLATVTARGSTTTVPLTFFGGATVSNLNVTDTANIVSLIATNATFTQTTTTSLAANLVTTTQLFVAGQQVCLQDGTNCSSATTTLQAAYDNGRVLTLNDGKIQLNSVLGSGDDFAFLSAVASPVIGAGEVGTPNAGFDLSVLNGASTGTLFTFTDNRANPSDPTANTAYIAHVPGLDNTLIIGNATSYIQLDNDIALVASADNQLFFNQGRLEAQGNSDITNTAVYNLVDNCITCSSDIIRLSNGLGANAIHLYGNSDPNGVVNPYVASGDLLIRSGSLGGSGTQLYVNVDGTNTGWRGLATTDMLSTGDVPMSLLSENLALSDNFSQIDVEGRLAFVLYNSGEWGIIDVSEPGVMIETYHNVGTPAVEGHFVGRRLYVLDVNARITVYDFSDPTAQVILGTYDLPDPAMAQNAHFVVEGSVMYVGSDNALLTVDVKNPANMTVLDDQSPPPGAINYTHITVQDGFIYFTYKDIGDPTTNILTVDANDPSSLSFFGTISATGQDQNDSEVHVSDNRLYVKGYNGSEQVINVYRITAGMIDPGILAVIDPVGDQIDHFEVNRGRVYTSGFAQDSTQDLFQSFIQNLDGTYSGEQLLQPGIRTTNTSGSPTNFVIEGGYAYGAGFNGVNDLLSVLDLGGMRTRSMRATNGDFGQISVANNLTVRGTANFTNGITVDGRAVCLSDGSNCASMADTSNAAMESHQGGEVTLGSMAFIDVEGRIALVVLDDYTAHLYDASWPADQLEQRVDFPNIVTGKLAGNRLYALETSGDLTVYDISDMDFPDMLGTLNITSGEDLSFDSGAQIAVNGSVLYLSTTNTIRTVDIRDPGAMTVLDAEDFADGDVRYPHMAFLDGFLYFARKEPLNIDNETTVLTAYNVRNPSNISSYDTITYVGRDRNDTKIAVYNHKIYFQRFGLGEEVIGIRQLNSGMFGTQVATIEPPTAEIGHFEVSNNNLFVSGFNEGGPEQNILYTYVSNGNDYDLESTMSDAYRTTDTDASPENFDIEGTWLIGGGMEFVIPGEYTIYAIDLGGLKTRSVFASGGDFGDVIVGNKLMVQGLADFTNGITVQGLAVCLADGTGCPAAVGGATLQSAYDAGRTISLNDGHIELNGQTGSPTDVTWNGDQYTRLIGGGLSDIDSNKGFDIAMYEDGPNARTISMLFSNDRNNPDGIGVNTSQIRHYSIDGVYQELSMNSGDSYIFTSTMSAGIGFDSTGNNAEFNQTTLLANNDGHLEVQNYTGNYVAMSLFNNQNGNTVLLKTGLDDPNFNATGTAGDVYYRGGLNGSGTQMYLNVDGTINGWKGVATTDMLSGDAPMSLVSTIATTAFSNRLNVQNGKAVSLDFGSNWELFDMSDAANPVSRYVSSTAMSIGKINDNRLYMIESSSDILHVFDISDLSLPIVLGTIDLAGGASSDKSIDVVGSTVYVATEFGTYIVDAATPSAMTIVNTIPASGSTPLVKVMDGYLYRSAKADIFGNPTTTVEIYDIRAPLAPALLSTFDATSNVFTNNSLEISGNDLFVWGMTAPNAQPLVNHYDVTDRANPVLVNQIITPGSTYWNFTAKNGSIYASNFTGSRCLDRLAYDGTLLETNCSFNNVGEIVIDGNYAHVAARLVGSGIQTIDLGGKIVHGLRASTGDFGHVSVKDGLIVGGKADFANDISVKGISVCLADGTNCQAGGSGLASADMSRLPLSATLSGGPYDVDVEGRLAFVSYKFNWELYDLTNPTVPELVYADATPMRTAQIVGNRLYGLEDGADIIHIYDVSDPANTVQLGTFDTASSTGDSAELTVEGSNIVLATADGLYVIDAKNPASMSLLSFTALNRAYPRLAVQDGFAYYSSKPGYGILDTTTTVNVIDIRNPSAPIMAVSFDVSGRNRPDNELQIADRRLYINGRSDIGGEQINVYDISNQAAPSFVSSTNPIGEVVDHFVVNRGRFYIASFEADSTQNIFESWVINENGDLTHEQTLNPGIHTTNNNDHPELFDIEGAYVFGWGFDAGTDYLAAINLGGLNLRSVIAANADLGNVSIGTRLSVRGAASFSNDITVNGRGVCLSDGTNCPLAGGASDWVYSTTTNFLRPATSTANLVIGGTSTTVSHMNALFTMDGDDLYVGGNIGSASSVYTNGEFVVGPGSTHYGDGYIQKTDGNLTLGASGGYLLPSSDLGLTLGSSSMRFNGEFGSVTTSRLSLDGGLRITTSPTGTNLYPGGSQDIYLSTQFTSLGSPNVGMGIGHWSSSTIPNFNTSTILYFSTDLSAPIGTPNVTSSWIKYDPTYDSYEIGRAGYSGSWIATSPEHVSIMSGYNQAIGTFSVSAHSMSLSGDDGITLSAFSGPIILGSNDILMESGSSSPMVTIRNNTSPTGGSAWGAYIDQLLIGNTLTATGTANYMGLVAYDGVTRSGLCLDDTGTAQTCPVSVGNSIMADGAVSSNAFDLAEVYAVNGPSTPGDVVVFDPTASATVQIAAGNRYDRRIAGVVSTKPGFVLGWSEGAPVALAGRVPTKVSVTNGEIKVGDALTTSEYPGYAMKATKPGMILGYALEDVSTTGTIEVFIDTGYNAFATLGTDGSIATLTDDLVVKGLESASASTSTIDSFGLTFHGEGWDTTSSMALAYDFTLRTDMLSTTNARFVIENNFGSSTFSVDQDGVVRANGFEVNDSFDLAERYESADALEPGDLVMISPDADRQILRSMDEQSMAIGVISTKAGFTLGANASGTYPVALAGRVPTKVTALNGEIKRGDALVASTIPGVAQKATVAGQIIGYALEGYAGADNGLIEAFIQPGLWIPKDKLETLAGSSASTGSGTGAARQGFAKIITGGSRVHIAYSSINAFPVPQVTAMGNVSGGWWLENVSDTGFDIVMDTIQPIDVQFAWQVSPSQVGIMQYRSDGTYGQLDPLTGQLVEDPDASPEPEPEAETSSESVPEEAPVEVLPAE